MIVVALADAPLRAEYVSFLAAQSLTPIAASGARDAVGIVQRLLPEIILVDLDQEGLAAARTLRESPLVGQLGIVALADSVTEALERVARDAGCDLLLGRPCPPVTLFTELLVLLAQLAPDSVVTPVEGETAPRRGR
jgi:CheY-like chemotaxis protein